MEDTASTHIMAHDQDITHIGLEDPVTSFLVFAEAWIKHDDNKAWQKEALPVDALRQIYHTYSEKLNGLHQPAVEDLDTDLVALLVEKGLITPPTSPRLTPEAPGAPIAPSRPQMLALALETAGGTQASGQPLAAVRALFGAVPAGVPDA